MFIYFVEVSSTYIDRLNKVFLLLTFPAALEIIPLEISDIVVAYHR